jgi:hypothetical protein
MNVMALAAYAVPYFLALALASITVLYDCHVSLQDRHSTRERPIGKPIIEQLQTLR